MNKTFLLILGMIFLTGIVSSAGFGYDISNDEVKITTTTINSNITNLSELRDTNIPTPSDNEVLTWDDTAQEWIAQAVAGGTDTNETSRFYNLTEHDCSGTDKMVGVQENGTVLCEADIDTGGSAGGSFDVIGNFLINDTALGMNITNLTLTDKITFGFLESINNLVDGIIEIVGKLKVTGDIETDGILVVNGNVIGNGTSNFTFQELNATGSGSGDNSSWNKTYSDTLYSGIEWDYNQTENKFYYNQTENIYYYNMSDGSGDTINGTSLTIANITNFLYNYNQTLAGTGDNSTWNEELANTLYSAILWGYNQTENKFYYNQTDGSGNTINGTSLTIANITNFLYNYNQTENKYYYNMTIGSSGDNSSWNKSYADTLYYGSDNPSNYWNESTSNFSSSGFNTSVTNLLKTTYHNATSSILVAGVLDEGDLTYTQHPDGSYDSDTLNFSETSGSPGLDLRVNFTNITKFSEGIMRYKTSTIFGDSPIRQLWNYDTSEWEDYPVLAESITFSITTQTIYDYSDHIQNGVIQMRMYKAGNGNTNNHYYIDWVTMAEGVGVPSGEEVDPYSWHRGDVDSGNYTTIGNVSANVYFGDGSKLTGISGGNASWNESYANTLYANVTWDYNQTDNKFYYNQSDGSYNATYNEWSYNQTTGTENIFDQNLNTTNNVTFGNVSVNWFFGNLNWSWLQNIPILFSFSDFQASFDTNFSDKTTDDLTEGTTNIYDNSSWNESYANTLYANVTWDYNQTDTIYFYNMSDTPYFYNMTVGGSDNSSWNQSYASTLYSGIEWDYNQTETYDSNITFGNNNISEIDIIFIENKICINDACTSYINETCTIYSNGATRCMG